MSYANFKTVQDSSQKSKWQKEWLATSLRECCDLCNSSKWIEISVIGYKTPMKLNDLG